MEPAPVSAFPSPKLTDLLPPPPTVNLRKVRHGGGAGVDVSSSGERPLRSLVTVRAALCKQEIRFVAIEVLEPILSLEPFSMTLEPFGTIFLSLVPFSLTLKPFEPLARSS